MSGLHQDTELSRCAEDLAASLTGDDPNFDAVRTRAEREYLALLHAVRKTHARFAFDRDGRPGAVNAVREALPVMERDLFEAVLEDHACELAAVEEALYQFALALARARK
jgi:hypothetical protein